MPFRHLFALWLAAIALTAGAMPVAAFAQAGRSIILIGFRPTAPYVLQRADGMLSGLEYDLVMAAGDASGLPLLPQLAPFGRLPEDFRRRSLDAMVPANPAMALPGCLSDTVLVYRNIAISLRQRGLVVTFISDLARLDVTAFQNASLLLGGEVAALRSNPARYREVANQMLQVRALFSGRTDVVVADRRIFRHLMRSPEADIDTSAPVTEHDIFPPIPYAVAFQRNEDCAAFNTGLAAIKRSGVYDEILRRWDNPPQAKSGGHSIRPPSFG